MCSYVDAIKTAAQVAIFAVAKVRERNIKKAVEEYQTNQIIQEAHKLEDSAAEVRQEALENVREKRLQTILAMGQEKSSFAAGNLAASSMTLFDINNDEEQKSDLESLKIMNSAERKAKNYLLQADNKYSSAELKAFTSEQNRISDNYSIASGFALNTLNQYTGKNNEEINAFIGNKITNIKTKFKK